MKGICFKEPLFLKVVAGLKTQTRRIMKMRFRTSDNLSPLKIDPDNIISGPDYNTDSRGFHADFRIGPGIYCERPRYKPGEIVYLKEPYFIWEPEHCNSMSERFAYKYWDKSYKMKADIQEAIRKEEFELGYDTYYWHNKLFMKADYARYFIKITDVRAERLIDISKADAIAEGMDPDIAFSQFANTWKSIHGIDSWADNPWVFAYTFKLTNKP
jgi:hypothetical protein